jgi:hypothetical protein
LKAWAKRIGSLRKKTYAYTICSNMLKLSTMRGKDMQIVMEYIAVVDNGSRLEQIKS